jgi:NAD dependent epimerase/dehydratase family enzyme
VFRLGLGGRLGDGQQIMSWIALADWLRAVDFMMQRHLAGQPIQQIYNLTAPNPVNNAEFTQLLAKYVNRPALLPLPSRVLKLMFGEMATLLIDGQKVLPKHLIDDGFVFLYPSLDILFNPSRE